MEDSPWGVSMVDLPEAVHRIMRPYCDTGEAVGFVDGQPYISYLKNSAADFDRHWSDNELADIPAAKKLVAEGFLKPLQAYLVNQPDAIILDAGCGDGVHTAYLPMDCERQACIGLDISCQALIAASKRASGGWTFVHGDAGDVPLLDDSVDAAFSFGVLAYTSDPAHSFRELCRVVKPGGIVGVWILPDQEGFAHRVLKFLRGVCRITSPLGARVIADCIVPWLYFVPTCSGMHLGNSSWKQCREIVLVDLAPEQLIFPTAQQVRSWFEEQGLEIQHEDVNQPITLWGRRPEAGGILSGV